MYGHKRAEHSSLTADVLLTAHLTDKTLIGFGHVACCRDSTMTFRSPDEQINISCGILVAFQAQPTVCVPPCGPLIHILKHNLKIR